MDSPLREFVYLDTTSVNSLLASMFMAVPETIRKVAAENEKKTDQTEMSAGINLQSLLNFGGSTSATSTTGTRELSEVGRRVNDQYRFSILVRALEQNDKREIHDIASDCDGSDIEPGSLVRLKGTCTTDPLYPLLTALHFLTSATNDIPQGSSFWTSLMQNQSEQGQVEQIYDLLYGGWIGLKMVPSGIDRNFGMAIDEPNTWIDPHREFRGSNEYTILGRVQNQLSTGEIWDVLEILRVLDSVASDDEMSEQRLELIARLLDELEDQNPDDEEFRLPEMNADDFVVEGEATIVDPIAIYW